MAHQFNFTKQNRLSVFERFDGLDWSAIATILDGWEPGQRGYVEIKKRGNRKSREQLSYYYAVILPAVLADFKTDQGVTLNFNIGKKMVTLPLSLETCDWFFKLNYAEYNSGEYKDKSEMNMAECAAFEDYCIKWLYTHRNVHVPPADKNWRENQAKE